MKRITPSEALVKMEGFASRVDRIEKNKYTNPRFRTMDLNKLRFEYKYVYLWHSIAFYNKNQERAMSIIERCNKRYRIAYLFM